MFADILSPHGNSKGGSPTNNNHASNTGNSSAAIVLDRKVLLHMTSKEFEEYTSKLNGQRNLTSQEEKQLKAQRRYRQSHPCSIYLSLYISRYHSISFYLSISSYQSIETIRKHWFLPLSSIIYHLPYRRCMLDWFPIGNLPKPPESVRKYTWKNWNRRSPSYLSA